MNYEVVHRTSYEYTAPVSVSYHVARLDPRETTTQKCQSSTVEIFPEPTVRGARSDYFGNRLCFFTLQEVHDRLDVVARSRVGVELTPAPVTEDSPPWDRVAELFCDPVSPDVVVPYQFVFDSPHVHASRELADYAQESFARGVPILAAAGNLMRRIHADFRYDPKATTVATPLEEVVANRRGICQDFAHLAIGCLRSLGLPARYVSGYLHTHPGKGQQRLVGADASHAWFSVFSPGTGWVDFDPTNNLLPADEHITVAVGRDYSDVSPVAGVLTGGGEHTVQVSVDVARVEKG